MTAIPGARDIVRLNRDFLRRAIHFLVASGVRQFLDLGSGIPTVGKRPRGRPAGRRADPGGLRGQGTDRRGAQQAAAGGQ